MGEQKSLVTVNKWLLVTLVVIVFALMGLAAWVAVWREAEPVPSEQSFGSQAVVGFSGGEQLVYGMPWSILTLTPTPIPLLADHHAGALVGITWEHYQIHEANSYRVDANDADLDNNERLSLCFTTPHTDTAEVHLFGSAVTTGPSVVAFYEAPAVSGGTEVTPVNRYRLDPVTSTVKSIAGTANRVTLNPTITTTGAITLVHGVGGAAQGVSRLTTDVADYEEFELQTATTYCAIVTANADNLRASMTVRWYELARGAYPIK